MKRGIQQSTYSHMLVLWNAAREAPIRQPDAARLIGMSVEGARKLLDKMAAQGHVTLLPRTHVRDARVFAATGKIPIPPEKFLRTPANELEKKRKAESSCLSYVRRQFALWPHWLVRIPVSADEPAGHTTTPMRVHVVKSSFVEDALHD